MGVLTHVIYRSIYSFLWFAIKPYKWHYAIIIAAPILSSFYDFGNYYALKLVVDAFSTEANVGSARLFYPIAIFISVQILHDVVWRISSVAEWRSEPYVRQSIFKIVYDHVQNNPYPFFQNTLAGSVTSKIKGILDGYDHFGAAIHHEFTPKLANVVVLTMVLAIVNVQVFVFVCLWVILFSVVMWKFSRVLDRLAFVRADERHSLFALIGDNISNILTIFSFATRSKERERLNQKIEKDYIPSETRLYHLDFLAAIVAGVLYWALMISLFLFMIHLRQTDQVSSGDLVFVMGITIKMSNDLWQLIQRMQDLMKNIGDFKSACELLRTPIEEPHPETLKAIEIKEPSIVFDQVSFSYDTNHVVFSDLSLNIRAGEKVGIVGLSGAGKSTLVSLVLKYFPVTEGRILVDGTDLSDCLADSIRSQVAVIPQDILLFHRTILDNILYGRLEATQDEVIEAAKLANIHEFVMSLPEQYQTLVGERGIKLSGGQRQRIAIARAVLKNAPILILDEATSSLDVETEQLIQLGLNTLLERTRTTVLAIAHRLSTLKHMDRIVVLEQGRVIEEGTHLALMEQESVYKKLWDMQQI